MCSRQRHRIRKGLQESRMDRWRIGRVLFGQRPSPGHVGGTEEGLAARPNAEQFSV